MSYPQSSAASKMASLGVFLRSRSRVSLRCLRSVLQVDEGYVNCLINHVKKYSSESEEEVISFVEQEDEIAKLRDVSRMPEHLKQMLNGESRNFESVFPLLHDDRSKTPHAVKNLKRKSYARYGKASGVDPGALWPTKDELAELKRREKEFYPTLQEMMANVAKEKHEEAETIRLREEEVREKLAKLDFWMKDLENRKAKKVAELEAQKAKKERMAEEVRAHFGYRISPKDEKFQELMEQKEKEEKKAAKEARKKEKIAKELARLEKLVETAKQEAGREDATKSKTVANDTNVEDNELSKQDKN